VVKHVSINTSQFVFEEKTFGNFFIAVCYVKSYITIQKFTWRSRKMNMNLKNKITTKQLAAMAIFAALYVVLSLITPIRIPTGIGMLEIGFAALIASIFGIILGPYLGAGTALLGSTVACALTGMTPYTIPFILAPMFNALIVGFIFYKKWKYAFVVFAIMIAAFLFTPPVTPLNGQSILTGDLNMTIFNWQIALYVLFDKIVAIALIIPLGLFGKKMSFAYGGAFFFILGFIGNQADNIFGTLIFSTPLVYESWGMDIVMVQVGLVITPFVYPVIRLIQAAIVMVIAMPLVRILQNANWLWSEDNIFTDKKPSVTTFELTHPIK
jgi:ECF transporter S component (folate family)